MRKIIVSEYVSLDGVMDDPGGSEGSAHGGWSFKFWSGDAAKFKYDELFACDALLLGRVTYQGFASAWPSIKDEQGFA
ncbi:MAG TPA: dihydrofolate reductase, partial [Anaerolineae bacterium]